MNDNPSNFRPQNSASGSQQYLDANIRMASPAKLRLMLIERAVEVAGALAVQWRSDAASNGPPGDAGHSVKLIELLSELLSGVAGGSNDAENKLCLQVADLYVFLLQHLVAAEQPKDAESIDEIQLVLQAEAETWRAAVAQEGTQQMAAGGGVPAPVGSSTAGGIPGDTSVPRSGGLNFSA